MANILMLCHDQSLDRRVVAQATTLIGRGHTVRLLALSFDADTHIEQTVEGIALTRIGLSFIVPENRIYRAYVSRQNRLNDVLNALANRYPSYTLALQRGFALSSRANWALYVGLLAARYRNRSMHDPLPFRTAFLTHAGDVPSDLVQVHDLPALAAGTELAKAWGVPLVYDAHELYPEQCSFSRVQRAICAKAERECIQHADLVFTVNESIAVEMESRYRIARPVVVTNAVDPPATFDGNVRYDLIRQKLGLAAGRRILLMQGGLAPHRNLNELVSGMAYVRTDDVDLVIMGSGDHGLTLKATAQKTGLLNKRVYFLPAVPQCELLQHTASADMGIIPYPHVDLNSYFCTPNKLFEFIQAGLPIIANDSPELRRFVVEEGFGIARQMRTPQDIARAIDIGFQAGEHAAWRERLAARRHVFTWRVQSEAYLAAVERWLDRG